MPRRDGCRQKGRWVNKHSNSGRNAHAPQRILYLLARSQFCEHPYLLYCSPDQLFYFLGVASPRRLVSLFSIKALNAGSLRSKYQRVASRHYSLFSPLCRGVVVVKLICAHRDRFVTRSRGICPQWKNLTATALQPLKI